jgi:mRNA interferase MazF
MTTKSHKYPTRFEINLQSKKGWIVLDQIRTIDKQRLIKKVGEIDENDVLKIKAIIMEMLVK